MRQLLRRLRIHLHHLRCRWSAFRHKPDFVDVSGPGPVYWHENGAWTPTTAGEYVVTITVPDAPPESSTIPFDVEPLGRP